VRGEFIGKEPLLKSEKKKRSAQGQGSLESKKRDHGSAAYGNRRVVQCPLKTDAGEPGKYDTALYKGKRRDNKQRRGSPTRETIGYGQRGSIRVCNCQH